MHPAIIVIIVTLASIASGGNAYAACSPQQILRDDVLIVVNDNSIASPQIGDYYCEQRGIDPANIAHVRVPATSDVQLDQFIVLRDQLIKFLLENTLPAGTQQASCDQSAGYTRYYCPATVDQIRQLSKIRYLVLTKGIPARFTFTGSTLAGNPEAVVDNYLRFWLLNYYNTDVRFFTNQRAFDFADGRGMRTVNPMRDREFIVGRIEGIDANSSRQLVDRAITAEKNGIFGKLYGSKFGPQAELSTTAGAYLKRWLPDGSTIPVYPSWKYLHGLFGNMQSPTNNAVRHLSNAECLTYDINGNVPQNCVTRLTSGGTEPRLVNDLSPGYPNDPPPGSPAGRITRADTSLIYQGYTDGFSSLGTFSNLLNWREDDNCPTLCATNDSACRAASTDAYKEIDTRCVRVADGFIGYNLQSFPLGMMAAWPTGWFQSSNTASDRWVSTGSQTYFMWPAEVRNDTGFNDNYSLWYRNTDQKLAATCYTGSDDLQRPPAANCVQEKRIFINQRLSIPQRTIDPANPQKITVRFKYRALNINKTSLHLMAKLLIHEEAYKDPSITIPNNNQIDYGAISAAKLTSTNSPADGTSWGDAIATFTLDPALHLHPQKHYDGLKIQISSNLRFEGKLAIDNVSVEEDGINIPLLNASFDAGHQQLSGGDSAVTFLNRLNGVAFWGNISHHETKGVSFSSHPYETLVYFMRGLPLGDAVWFSETHNSGILYGDPLYSPIAIYMHRLPSSDPQAPIDHFITTTPLVLQGDTLNGSGPNVTTTYSVDFCNGSDFHTCDLGNSWIPISNLQNKPGGNRDMPLGSWDISARATGSYTLRLAVTSSNSTRSISQTFYDYYPVTLFTPTSDTDVDGLSYTVESSLGTHPWNADTDADGMPDGWEVTYSLDPHTPNSNADSDSDGFSDYIEYARQSNPNDPNAIPAVSTLHVDPLTGIDNGRSPFKTITAAIAAAQAGDTLLLAAGHHNDTFMGLSKPLRIEGQADLSAIISPIILINNTSFDMEIKHLTLQTTSLGIYGPGLNFRDNAFIGNTTVNNGTVATITNSTFSSATLFGIDVKGNAILTLDNTTITNNSTGIRSSAGSSVQITNSIITGNTLADLTGIPSAAISYSLVGDPAYANFNGNITANPMFINPAIGDYHLMPDSPAVDAGDPAADYSLEPYSPVGRVNMGAYGNTSEAATAPHAPGSGFQHKAMPWLPLLLE